MARSGNREGKGVGDPSTGAPQASGGKGGGYGQPPVHSQWKKGQSGNPRGRPRKPKPLPFSKQVDPFRDLFIEEMERVVDLKEGGQRTRMEVGRAIMRSVANGAMQGDLRKQKLVMQLASAAEQSSKAERVEYVRFVTAYKAMWDPIFSSAAKAGKAEPEQLPHPDHVNIDLMTGEMVISGPLERHEKLAWDHLKFQLRENTKLLAEMMAAAAAKLRNQAAANRVALVEDHQHALSATA